MSSEYFSHWEVRNNVSGFNHGKSSSGVAGSIIGPSGNRSVKVRVTAIGAFTVTGFADSQQFAAISKVIFVKVPKGILGLKWKRGQWNYTLKPGERIQENIEMFINNRNLGFDDLYTY